MNEVKRIAARGPARLLAFSLVAVAAPGADLALAQAPAYDIVYVRWPRRGDDALVMLPQAEDPYRASRGADLVLLRADGSQQVLVDCEACCVQDPAVSCDGEWVYYTKMLDGVDARSPSLLFKMRIGGPEADFRDFQLTFDDGFTGRLHAGNDGAGDDLARRFSIRDMGPCPLPGSKLAFTSNRHAAIAFRQGTAFNVSDVEPSCVMQIHVMDDHDGRLRSADLANLRRVGQGSLHMAMHPVLLQDGRLLFSNWDDAGGKFLYGMTTLYVMRPDGSRLEALTEPHDRHKNVDHFATQLANGDIVTAQYYPSFDFGYGHLVTFPLAVDGPAYTRGPSPARNTHNGFPISFRDFDRKGWTSLTPHTAPDDCPAPGLSGKYSMPAAAPLGSLLVAYSPGGVNHFSGCNGGTHHYLDSGLYLIPDAGDGRVTDPGDPRQLVEVLNSPEWNEIWPRPVVRYAEIHGLPEPRALPWTDPAAPDDDRLEPGAPHAIAGTSSLYNRESAPRQRDDFRPSTQRESAVGSWTIQGTDAGVVRNADIHAVRIVGVVPKPYRQPISRYGSTSAEHAAVARLLHDDRADTFVEGYAATHWERWKIIAEIPVRKTDAAGAVRLDPQGQPDTSFVARIPASTPFFFQGIDRDGLTLFSETTWRALVPGESRADCGGCHAHSIERLPIDETAAGRRLPIQVAGIDAGHPMLRGGVWDVTDSRPLLAAEAAGAAVEIVEGGMVGIEYHRDVLPVLRRRCAGCHATTANSTGTDLALDGTTATDDPYFRLVLDGRARFGGPAPGGSYAYPQLSRYVRANQARQSLLAWKLLGRRLDGRTDAERPDDLDFTPHVQPHGATAVEVRTITRWIDLGCPIDFQGDAHRGYRYTDDNGLPVIAIGPLQPGWNASFDGVLRVGLIDAESGIDWSSLEVALDDDLTDAAGPERLRFLSIDREPGSTVARVPLGPLELDRELLLAVTVQDHAGNRGREALRFWISDDPGGGPGPQGQFRRGDVNRDRAIDVSDPSALLAALFFGQGRIVCEDAADANDDGVLDISDAVSTLVYLFIDGARPLPEPSRVAGEDPTLDALDCER